MFNISKKTVYLYLFLIFSIWGSLYVVSKFVFGNVPTFTALLIRNATAAFALSIILKQRKNKKIKREDYKYILIIGFFGYFLSVGAQFLGTKLTNASFASLINSMNPITITLFASLILKEKVTPKTIISIIVLVIGVKILIGDINDNLYLSGIFLSLFSVTIWSLVTVLAKKVSKSYDPFQITVYGIMTATVFCIPVSIYEITTSPVIKFNFEVIAALLYMGLICTAMAHALWNKCMSIIDAGTCSLFYPIQPLVATLLGIIFLNEKIDKNFILGAVLIVGAVLFNVISGLKKDENQVMPGDKKD
ncbi:MAG TPA: EamA family transporter [Sedimentibacter sp.]|nr:EamA family transporter [Sedimentibacter sp.]HOW22263.1 EamA family transporter [Sedimentibacter sp.]HRC80387.1 EamA family transporter [Sedimentibacter sp.]